MGFARQEYWSGVPLPSPYIIYSRHQTILLIKTLLHIFRLLNRVKQLKWKLICIFFLLYTFPSRFSFLYPFSLIYPFVLYPLIFIKFGASGSDINHLNPGFCLLLAVWLWEKDLAALTSNVTSIKWGSSEILSTSLWGTDEVIRWVSTLLEQML